MKIVGDKLCDLAIKSGDVDAVDKFGRSAFNRYYYAAYLHVRSALRVIDPSWASCSHKGLPTLLTSTVLRRAKSQARRLVQAGHMTRSEEASLLDSMKICVSELAQILISGYSVRCIADYSPEQTAVLDKGTIRLGGSTATSAQRWPERASVGAGHLQSRWKELGI